MPAVTTSMHDYLRSARAGIVGGVAITAVYCFIAVLSTPRPSNGDLAAFAGLVIGFATICALLVAGAVVWARDGEPLAAALLSGLFSGAVVAFIAEVIVNGWPQGEESHGVLVMTVAAMFLGSLVGAMCWVGARR